MILPSSNVWRNSNIPFLQLSDEIKAFKLSETEGLSMAIFPISIAILWASFPSF